MLFGTPPANLAKKIAGLRAVAPGGRLLVSSDEEGGNVQRMATLIGKMPSAKTIGQTKTPEQTRALAFKFGKRMKKIGIGTDLAPVADLSYPGSWTDTDGRAFKSNRSATACTSARSLLASRTLASWPPSSTGQVVGPSLTPTLPEARPVGRS